MPNRLLTLGRDLTRGLLGLLYPEICSACGQSLREEETRFCAACRTALSTDPHPACPRCASSVGPFAKVDDGCGYCRDDAFHFDGAVRMAPYDGLLRELILRMKNESGEMLSELMGELFAETMSPRLRLWQPDWVIAIPLHWRRRWSRGFNQSEAVARAVAAALGVRGRPGWLRRIRHTPDQIQQTPAGRRQNIKGAFAVSRRAELKDRTVLLIDDVLTTGSTASEAAKALKQAGAAKVWIAVLGHGK